MPKFVDWIAKGICAGAFALALAAPALAQPAPRLVVFGDSLSDPGNAFALVGGTNTPPDYSVDPFFVPSQPYARGGHHFTNGDTWIELLARARGMNANAQPAFRSNAAGAANYAIGGARARDDGGATSLSRQVDAFLGDAGGTAPGGALYVIEVGGNDIRDIAQTRNPGLGNAAIAAIQANIVRLYGAGARTFLVWNAPKVAATPAILMVDEVAPGTAQAVDGVTLQYNVGLAQLLAGLQAALPGVKLVTYDVYANLAAIVASPATFGLTNVTDPCIRPNVAPFFCQTPNTYLFWDGIHPTEAVHAIIAKQVGQLLGP